MLRCAEEETLRVRREHFPQIFMRYQEVGVAKTPKFPIACNINRVETTKITSPPNPNRLYSTLLLPLALRHCQLRPRRRGIMGDKPDKVTEILACEGEPG